MIDAGGVLQRAVSDRVFLDRLGFGRGVAELAQCLGHHAVDDLEGAAAGQLLELDQGAVGLEACGVAVHHQSDGAGGRDHRNLGVAKAVLLAEIEGVIPGPAGGFNQQFLRAVGGDQRHRRDRQALVAAGGGAVEAVSGPAVVADHPQHRLAVGGVAGESAQLFGHLGRSGVGDAGHDRAEGCGHRPALVAVVGQARGHQEATDVGVTEAEGAVFVGKLSDLLRRVLGHQHRDFQHDRPKPAGVLIGGNVDLAG